MEFLALEVFSNHLKVGFSGKFSIEIKAVFVANNFPELSSNLVATLPDLKVHYLSHTSERSLIQRIYILLHLTNNNIPKNPYKTSFNVLHDTKHYQLELIFIFYRGLQLTLPAEPLIIDI